VQFRILGPLEVLDDHGRPLVLGGAKQRGRVPWSGGIEGVVVNLSDGAGAGR